MSATVASVASTATDAKRPRPEALATGWEDLVPAAKKQAQAGRDAPHSGGDDDDDDDVPIVDAADVAPGDEVKYRHVVGGRVVGILAGTVLAVARRAAEGGGASFELKVSSTKANGAKITRTIKLVAVVAHEPPEPDSEADDEADEADEAPEAPEASEASEASEDEDDDPKDADYAEGAPRAGGAAQRAASAGSDADYSESESGGSDESESESEEDEEPPPRAPTARAKLVLGGEPSGYDSDDDDDAIRATSELQTALLARPRKQGQPPLKNQGRDQAKQYRGWIAALLKVKARPSDSDEEAGEDFEDFHPYNSYRSLRLWRRAIGRGTLSENRVREYIARAFELDRGRVEQAKYVGQTMCALNLLMDVRWNN